MNAQSFKYVLIRTLRNKQKLFSSINAFITHIADSVTTKRMDFTATLALYRKVHTHPEETNKGKKKRLDCILTGCVCCECSSSQPYTARWTATRSTPAAGPMPYDGTPEHTLTPTHTQPLDAPIVHAHNADCRRT
jgi:hypothetical protein